MSKETTKVTATWQGDLNFISEDDEGGTALLGDINGSRGIRPMKMLLASLAGCTGVDVALILKKKRVNLTDLKVEVSGIRADTHPKVYTDVHINFLLWGEGLKNKDVEQAIDLSENKYCSISAMMKATTTIQTSYRILAPDEIAD